MLNVEVIYLPKEGACFQKRLTLQEGATIQNALDASGLFQSHPDVENASIGIFSQTCLRGDLVRDGDRIEVYRELTNDPKMKRTMKVKGK
jgi:putative ubiquitin-RnfH superfamily antitoxin RatB of RatAB toxin-antitoxin module